MYIIPRHRIPVAAVFIICIMYIYNIYVFNAQRQFRFPEDYHNLWRSATL